MAKLRHPLSMHRNGPRLLTQTEHYLKFCQWFRKPALFQQSSNPQELSKRLHDLSAKQRLRYKTKAEVSARGNQQGAAKATVPRVVLLRSARAFSSRPLKDTHAMPIPHIVPDETESRTPEAEELLSNLAALCQVRIKMPPRTRPSELR